jgi:hypothetical protein
MHNRSADQWSRECSPSEIVRYVPPFASVKVRSIKVAPGLGELCHGEQIACHSDAVALGCRDDLEVRRTETHVDVAGSARLEPYLTMLRLSGDR